MGKMQLILKLRGDDPKAIGIIPQSLCKVGNTLVLLVRGQLKYTAGDRPTEYPLLLVQLAKKFNSELAKLNVTMMSYCQPN